MVKLFDTGGIRAVLEVFEVPCVTEETRKKSYAKLIFCQKGSMNHALLIGDFASIVY
jgi:hypothetical protein